MRAGDAWAYGVAGVDISTGAFTVWEAAQSGLAAAIARLEPSEILVPDAVIDEPELKALWRETRAHVTPLARDGFDAASGERRPAAHPACRRCRASGSSPAPRSRRRRPWWPMWSARSSARPPLSAPTREAADATLAIDAATRANLELTQALGG